MNLRFSICVFDSEGTIIFKAIEHVTHIKPKRIGAAYFLGFWKHQQLHNLLVLFPVI